MRSHGGEPETTITLACAPGRVLLAEYIVLCSFSVCKPSNFRPLGACAAFCQIILALPRPVSAEPAYKPKVLVCIKWPFTTAPIVRAVWSLPGVCGLCKNKEKIENVISNMKKRFSGNREKKRKQNYELFSDDKKNEAKLNKPQLEAYLYVSAITRIFIKLDWTNSFLLLGIMTSMLKPNNILRS